MLFMISNSMDLSAVDFQQTSEIAKNKSETIENNSDRESSIESFHTNKSELSITTETELIDVDDIELSDEESWLYKSPKKLTTEEKTESTEKWLEKSIDDMDDVELKATRTALLSKLNQLKLLNSSIMENEIPNVRSTAESTSAKDKLEKQEKSANEELAMKSQTCYDKTKMDSSDYDSLANKFKSDHQELRKNSEVFDVVDIQKIARLQEESLKQSTYKFLNQAGKKTMSIKDLSPASHPIVNLNKPASIEALNTCADKMNSSNMYSLVPLHNMKKHNIFSSSTTLNNSHELHRGSLPNINKGYYSLKSKKSKRPSEPKISCPLPIHPAHSKISLNGTSSQVSFDSHKRSDFCDQRETRTLPSSYRVHSRNNSLSRRDFSSLPISPRRESMPFLGNNSHEINQKDNHRKYSSPSVHSRYSTSASISPAKVFTSHMQNLRSPPSIESHRTVSHSPSKRLPLSTVQHQSPKKGSSLQLSKNGEIKTLKIPSKIPSPALRSGIPVPSTYSSKANEDAAWSQDCF